MFLDLLSKVQVNASAIYVVCMYMYMHQVPRAVHKITQASCHVNLVHIFLRVQYRMPPIAHIVYAQCHRKMCMACESKGMYTPLELSTHMHVSNFNECSVHVIHVGLYAQTSAHLSPTDIHHYIISI